jgi:hypothetical protein
MVRSTQLEILRMEVLLVGVFLLLEKGWVSTLVFLNTILP